MHANTNTIFIMFKKINQSLTLLAHTDVISSNLPVLLHLRKLCILSSMATTVVCAAILLWPVLQNVYVYYSTQAVVLLKYQSCLKGV